MELHGRHILSIAAAFLFAALLQALPVANGEPNGVSRRVNANAVTTHYAIAHDVSPPLTATLPIANGTVPTESDSTFEVCLSQTPLTSASVEQTEPGQGPAPTLVASFDGLGEGFKG